MITTISASSARPQAALYSADANEAGGARACGQFLLTGAVANVDFYVVEFLRQYFD